MMRPHLQQRFDQLLAFAKDPAHNLTAYENIAAAREMVDTLHMSDLLTSVEYNEYRATVATARLIVSAAVMKRVDDSLKLAMNTWDGSRTGDTVSVRGQQVEVSEFLRKPA